VIGDKAIWRKAAAQESSPPKPLPVRCLRPDNPCDTMLEAGRNALAVLEEHVGQEVCSRRGGAQSRKQGLASDWVTML
jgi:hypothetical protein